MKGFFQGSTILKQKPHGMIPKCGSCGLFRSCNTPRMEVSGKGKKRVLVLGECPGPAEDEQGRPFVGKASAFLRDTLAQVGVDLDEDAWSSYAVICRPPGNRTPDAKQINCCYPNLKRLLNKLRPRTVITLGRVPLASVLTGSGAWNNVGMLERWTGWQIPLKLHWLCPTYHPTFLLRSASPLLDRIFAEQLEKAFAIDTDSQPVEPGSIEILTDEEEAAERVLGMDRDGDWVAVDYETNSIKPEWHHSRIVSCAMSNGIETISFPWTKTVAKAVSTFLRSDRTWKIASNLKMEQRWTLKHLGHPVRNWGWDTMLAAHCIDNRPGICSLKFQSLVRLGVAQYNTLVENFLSPKEECHYNRIEEISLTDLLQYGGEDAYYEAKLAQLQRLELGFI